MRTPCLIALVLVTAVLSACGGESKPSPPPGSPENPLVAEPERFPAASESGRKPASKPGYQGLVESQGRKPRSRFTPCNLVTKAEAQAIVGLPMGDPIEAPKGPTCLYRTQDGKRLVTLAVQPLVLSKLERQVRHRRRVDVSDRTAFCGTLGAPGVYVALSRGRVLSVAARCEVGRRFALAAVRRFDG